VVLIIRALAFPDRVDVMQPYLFTSAMDKAVRSPHEQLSPCKGGNDTALDPIGKNFASEFAQLSLEEEETDDVICGISENVVRDVGKAAIELLAAR
jgi:hypothetical protein